MLAPLMMTIVAAASSQQPCRAAQITATLDARAGDFNGMSHSGTLLVLRNRGAACRIAALPTIDFLDARGRLLPIRRNAPGMYLGPVLVPVPLSEGGAVFTPLRWISGDVFERSRCLEPARLRMTIGGRSIGVRFAGRVCGPANKPAGFDQLPLQSGIGTSFKE